MAIIFRVEIFWPDQVNCDNEKCLTKIDDVYLYRDEGHFTVSGSKLVVEKMGLADRLAN